jgi:tetratricopeptide (TPR) repeat protein
LAQLLTQIARSEGLQRRFDDAHQTLDEADGLIDEGRTVARIRSLLERGRVFNSSKHSDKSRPLFLEAWELASSRGEDFYGVDAAHMLGIVDKGDGSLAWNEKAIALAERSSDEKANGWLGSLYNNTGWTYHEMGRFADALRCHEKNLTWHEEHDKTDKARVAKWCIARTLRSLNRVEEALLRQRELLSEHEALGTSDGYVHEELGECLLLLERAAEARPHFARAFELLSADRWLAANEQERLARLKKLASP